MYEPTQVRFVNAGGLIGKSPAEVSIGKLIHTLPCTQEKWYILIDMQMSWYSSE